MTLALVVGLAGAAGAVARWETLELLDRPRRARAGTAILVVNAAGSLLLGVLVERASPHVRAVVGTGFCGGLTTWSAAAWESVRRGRQSSLGAAAAFALTNLGLSLGAAVLGWALAR